MVGKASLLESFHFNPPIENNCVIWFLPAKWIHGIDLVYGQMVSWNFHTRSSLLMTEERNKKQVKLTFCLEACILIFAQWNFLTWESPGRFSGQFLDRPFTTSDPRSRPAPHAGSYRQKTPMGNCIVADQEIAWNCAEGSSNLLEMVAKIFSIIIWWAISLQIVFDSTMA